VIDPLGGSWYIESLTNRLEEEAEALIQRIEGMGGVLKAIETGFIQHEIHASAYAYQTAVERGEIGIIGVNRYVMEEQTRPAAFRVNTEVGRDQADRIAAVKARRDEPRVRRSLDELAATARSTGNLLLPLRECVRAYATIGEMCHTLRGVFGSYRDRGML
jgi:methylmalonyl-CoA mutase N-terminal domain/subunit